MEEGVIVAWHKKVGDKVSPGDVLAEVETDKATMDLESFHEGYLLYIGVKEGPVPVDGILAVIGKKDEDYKSALESAKSSGNGQPGKEEKEEESAAVKSEESVAVKSSKGSEKPSEAATSQTSEEQTREVQTREVQTREEQTREEQTREEQTREEQTREEQTREERIKSSPLARSIARESGLDLSRISGSGDQGRIIKRDVEVAAKKQTAAKAAPRPVPAGGHEDVPLSQMRKTIARRLVESKFTAPHFYLTMEVDMSQAVDDRKRINSMLDDELKISFNDIIVKACATALRRHPKVNASWLDQSIRIHYDVHIGIAVAVEDGLLVPVIRNTNHKSLTEIHTEIVELAERARVKKLQPEEMQGNTFTVSNLGMFGIEEFTAIINPPDACILAVGAIVEKPVVRNGNITTAQMMKITLSCDHRVVDGATGAQFLKTLKQFLEIPVSMLAWD
jgi:pyruvate dehydrogenase E2 component (dihydrolipoamide acetyltransferase)